jgi:hypothetical protein
MNPISALLLRLAGSLGVAALLTARLDAATEGKLTVNAGAHDRLGAVVTFAAPDEWKGRQFTIHELGVPLQVDDRGQATFVLPRLGKGETLTCTLAPGLPVFGTTGVFAKKDGSTLELRAVPMKTRGDEDHSQTILRYQMEAGPLPEGVPPVFAHGAHLHPVYSPSGKLVTANHPADHRWHRGIWMAWTKTEIEERHPDFWNQGKGEGPGSSGDKLLAEVRFASLDKSWSGPVQGGFVSQHRFIDHSGGEPKDVLRETWDVAACALRSGEVPLHLIDLVSTQTCASASPLKLPKYHYGGLGVRGHAQWDSVEAVTMLTSNGDDRKKGDSTKGRWVHIGGAVDGAPTGLAVLIHPQNFRFPQPLRLNPKNPQLCIAPSQDGDWSIEPGTPYISRYRLVVVDGPADAALLERLWQDYAEPVTVTVSAAK